MIDEEEYRYAHMNRLADLKSYRIQVLSYRVIEENPEKLNRIQKLVCNLFDIKPYLKDSITLEVKIGDGFLPRPKTLVRSTDCIRWFVSEVFYTEKKKIIYLKSIQPIGDFDLSHLVYFGIPGYYP